VQAALLYRHGSRFLAACQRRYGSVFTLRIVSIGTLVYLADLADIETVFAGNLYVIDKTTRCSNCRWGKSDRRAVIGSPLLWRVQQGCRTRTFFGTGVAPR
jgi:hypothetical protein